MNRIRLLIADDHPLLRSGIVATLVDEPDFEVVGQAASGEEAVDRAATLSPDVTLMDLKMPGLGGLEAISRILAARPDHRIIVLTSSIAETSARDALAAGAVGYLLKDKLLVELAPAIRGVHAGERWIDREIAEILASDEQVRPRLSPRELEVLRFIAQGRSNKQIANALYVSEQGIKSRIRMLLAKLDARDRAHAVLIATQIGYMES